jgi:predicted phage replisome organizer
MSDNKKYYYLKFKENYFDQDHIKVIEAMKNGYEYSLIILKLYLKAVKFDGQLKVNETIPYSSNKIDILASVLGHDPANVMHAINLAKDLGVIEILTTGEIFMKDIQSFIGHSSTEADRKRKYRSKLETGLIVVKDKCPTNVPSMSQERPPEIEIEIEIELELEEKFNHLWDIYDKKVGKEKSYKAFKKIKNCDYELILKHIPKYKISQPDKKFRKDLSTYLNQKAWNDEIILDKQSESDKVSFEESLKQLYGNDIKLG